MILPVLRKAASALLISLFLINLSFAHGNIQYLGNSAVLVESGSEKVLFDPFFHNDFGVYQLVPEDVHAAIMSGTAPYNDIDAIFISHAHEDHFSASDVATYLRKYPNTKLVAPQQAIDLLDDYQLPSKQLVAFAMEFNSPEQQQKINNIVIDAVRIPHAGWPGRKEVQNLVFRVQLNEHFSVMHMGDADPDDDHYLPYDAHWQKHRASLNFPPYWFFMSAEGRDILHEILNVEQHHGVHVPKIVPKYLQQSEYNYFSVPKERLTIE